MQQQFHYLSYQIHGFVDISIQQYIQRALVLFPHSISDRNPYRSIAFCSRKSSIQTVVYHLSTILQSGIAKELIPNSTASSKKLPKTLSYLRQICCIYSTSINFCATPITTIECLYVCDCTNTVRSSEAYFCCFRSPESILCFMLCSVQSHKFGKKYMPKAQCQPTKKYKQKKK